MASPPTGTLTFLFTDIEGSTKLWERHPEAMQIALARHDEILRDAIEERGGYVFKTVGDAYCAAFPTATDALEAAISAQRALHTGSQDEESLLRVRIAMHTGAAEERGGDYFGPTLNRVARLLSAGHGGQTLLSLPAQELVRDQLPMGAELRDLGEHRLKDLARPERVFELLAPDLPAVEDSREASEQPALAAHPTRGARTGSSGGSPASAKRGGAPAHSHRTRRHRQDPPRVAGCSGPPGRVPRRGVLCSSRHHNRARACGIHHRASSQGHGERGAILHGEPQELPER